jgi:hypothetical protein
MAAQAPGTSSRSRLRASGLDMVRSLGLVTLGLLVWLWFSHPRTPEEVRSVDWVPVASAAAGATDYEVLAPPASFPWPATSARVEDQADGTIVWRVGFLTGEEAYAGLLQRGVFPGQAAQAAEDWVAQETRNGVLEGTVVIGGRTWERSVGDPEPDERRSLVSRDGGTVTVVTGSASWAELERLASALQPVAAP